MEEKVIAIIAENLDVKPEAVTPDAQLIEDLGAESLSMIEIISDLEDTFDIEIEFDDYEKVKTLKDILNVLSQLVAA